MRQFSLSESALRSRAQRLGYRLAKSRRQLGINNAGGFMVVDVDTNCAVAGYQFDMEPGEVAEFLTGGD